MIVFQVNLILVMIKPFRIILENKRMIAYQSYLSIQIELPTTLEKNSLAIFSVE